MATAHMTLRRRIASRDTIQLILDFAWKRHTTNLAQLALDGNYEIIQWTSYQGLYAACRGGHRALVELVIKNGATNWEDGLRGAWHGCHCTLVDLMIKNGATNWHTWGKFMAITVDYV